MIRARRRLKYLYRVVDQRAGSDRPPLLAVSIHRGVVPRSSLTDDLPRAEDLSNYKLCGPGDIVLNRMRAFQGAIGISPVRGLVSPDYMVLRPWKFVDARYLHHLFRSTWFVGQMTARLRGIGGTESGSVRTPRINPEDLGVIEVDLPPLEEQRRIADFLDAETAHIDRLVELREEMSSLLMQRDRAMLDVEIESLGDRFGVLPFRRFVRRIEQGTSPQCDNVPAGVDEWGVLKVSAVKAGRFIAEQNKRLPDELSPLPRYEVRDGDLLVTRANTPALVGAAAVAQNPRRRLMLCDKIFRVDVAAEMSRKYLALVAQGTRIRDLCAEASHGTSQSMANLKTDEIKQWPIPVAPRKEQQALVERFEAASHASTALVASIRSQVELLEERRRAVVTAAVTGELDVTTVRGV